MRTYDSWLSLFQAVQACTLCPLALPQDQKIFGEGPVPAPMLLSGEGPGRAEVKKRRPFIGPSGSLLSEGMVKAKIDRASECFLANVLRCRATRQEGRRVLDRNPTIEEAENCSPYLFETIRYVQPRVIVTLGLPATQTILHAVPDMKKATLGALRKRVKKGEKFSYKGIPVVIAWHPAYVLRRRSTGLFLELVKDLEKAKRIAFA